MKIISIIYLILFILVFIINQCFLKSIVFLTIAELFILIGCWFIILYLRLSEKEYILYDKKIIKKNESTIIEKLTNKFVKIEEEIHDDLKLSLYYSKKNLNRILIVQTKYLTAQNQKNIINYYKKFLQEGKWDLRLIIITDDNKSSKKVLHTRYKSNYNEFIKKRKNWLGIEMDLLTNNGFLIISIVDYNTNSITIEKQEPLQHNSFIRFHTVLKRELNMFREILKSIK